MLNSYSLFCILIAIFIAIFICCYFQKNNDHKPLPLGKFNTILSSQVPDELKFALDKYCDKPEECDTSNLPEFFDCREKWGDLITKPLNQQQCGSCWSFATTTAISDRIRIHSYIGEHDISFQGSSWRETVQSIDKSKKPLTKKIKYERGDVTTVDNISPYTFAACDICELSEKLDPAVNKYMKASNDMCNMCCDGGIIQYAFIYSMVEGCLSIADDPEPWNYDCSNYQGSPLYKVKSVYNLKGRDTIKASVFNKGPAVCGFQVKSSFGQPWGLIPGTDVYGSQGTVKGGHAVCIMGWGTTKDSKGNRVDYWLLRNSWGSTWNDDGYFKMEMGANGIDDEVWGCTPFDVYDLKRSPSKPKPNLRDCEVNH